MRAAEELHALTTALRVFDDESGSGVLSRQQALARLAWEFEDIFTTDPSVVLANSSVQHSIDTGDAQPIRTRLYRRSNHERDIISRHVAKMKADGAIRDCVSPWAAQVVLTRKPCGSWRFCTDYSKLGKVTKRDTYPLPRIEALINVTQGATWFSTHDLSSGYWQTPMSTLDGSDLKTAFVTKDGTFCWKVMPFGLRNSGATMQRLVDETLGPLLWETVAAYVDDAVVFTRGETEEKAFAQHLLDLRAFYTRIRKAGLHLKPTKCRLGRRRVQLLGHIHGRR